MKKVKWSCILFALLLLTGCTSDVSTASRQEEPEAMYDLSIYESSVPTAFAFVSNGTPWAVMWKFPWTICIKALWGFQTDGCCLSSAMAIPINTLLQC
jgi:hypothetical protein